MIAADAAHKVNRDYPSGSGSPNEKPRGCAPWVVVLVILVVGFLLVALLISSMQSPPKADVSERSWRTELLSVQVVDARPTVQVFGTVQAPNLITERAAYPADVATVNAREGTRFAAGDVLATLDTAELELVLTQRKTDLKLLEIRHKTNRSALQEERTLLQLNQKELDRQQALNRRGAVSGSQLEQTRANVLRQELAVAQRQLQVDEFPARLAQAKAAVKQAQLDVDRAVITAPFAGVVARVAIAPGDRMQPGQELVAYYQPADIEVAATIPDQRLATILPETLPLPAVGVIAGQSIPLQLNRLAGQADVGSGGITGFFGLAIATDQTVAQAQIAPGQIVSITLELPVEKNVVLVPPDALYASERVYLAIPYQREFRASDDADIAISDDEQERLDECLVERIVTADDGLTKRQLTQQCKESLGIGYALAKGDKPHYQRDKAERLYRLQRVDVTVLGERSTSAGIVMLVRSEALQNGQWLANTQLPNAMNGLLVSTTNERAANATVMDEIESHE